MACSTCVSKGSFAASSPCGCFKPSMSLSSCLSPNPCDCGDCFNNAVTSQLYALIPPPPAFIGCGVRTVESLLGGLTFPVMAGIAALRYTDVNGLPAVSPDNPVTIDNVADLINYLNTVALPALRAGGNSVVGNDFSLQTIPGTDPPQTGVAGPLINGFCSYAMLTLRPTLDTLGFLMESGAGADTLMLVAPQGIYNPDLNLRGTLAASKYAGARLAVPASSVMVTSEPTQAHEADSYSVVVAVERGVIPGYDWVSVAGPGSSIPLEHFQDSRFYKAWKACNGPCGMFVGPVPGEPINKPAHLLTDIYPQGSYVVSPRVATHVTLRTAEGVQDAVYILAPAPAAASIVQSQSPAPNPIPLAPLNTDTPAQPEGPSLGAKADSAPYSLTVATSKVTTPPARPSLD